MSPFRFFVLAGALLASGPTHADKKPGNAAIEEPDKEGVEQRLEVFDDNKGVTACTVKGKVCLKAATGTQAEGSEAAHTFSRRAGAKGDWVVSVFGNFKKPAIAGNAQFMFSDSAESKAAKKRELTAMYQAIVKAGNGVSARVHLSGDEGFRPGRVYHVEIIQLLGGKEVLLAEGTFTLK